MLSGCGVYKNQFDCKPGKGIGCESVSKVNQLLDEDALDDFIAGKEVNQGCTTCGPIHIKEKMSIRFNKYRDADGHEHLPHNVELMI